MEERGGRLAMVLEDGLKIDARLPAPVFPCCVTKNEEKRASSVRR
jgi:hypothetical protein